MLSRREINSIKSLIEKGNVRKIIEKLDTGLDPNTQIEWYSLLGFAARQQQLGIVALLLDHGADPNQSIIYDQRRHTVLKWSIAPSNNEQVIELLLQRGMDPNMPDMYNFPPIYFVVMESSLENTNYLRLFLKYGAKVDKETFLTFKQVVYKNPNNRMPQELKQEIYELLIHAMKNQEMGKIFGTLRTNTGIAKATEEVSMVKRLPDEITDKILRSAITDKHPMHLYDVALSPSSRKHSRRVRNLKRSSSKKSRSK